MASLRLVARARSADILRAFKPVESRPGNFPRVFQIIKRDGTYATSEKYDENKEYTECEISQDPKEWRYVEYLLPKKTVPVPKKEASVNNWKLPKAPLKDQPYYIHRTKNYMQPVYLTRTYRGLRRVTSLKRIEGDIWALNDELKAFVEKNMKITIIAKVNEFVGKIEYKTDCVKYVKQWLDLKGF